MRVENIVEAGWALGSVTRITVGQDFGECTLAAFGHFLDIINRGMSWKLGIVVATAPAAAAKRGASGVRLLPST
jgi:hypothetical protein